MRPVVLADNLAVSGSGTLVFGAASSITDNGAGYGLAQGGPGTLILASSNTYAGGTTVGGGVLAAGAANVLSPYSDLTVSGGTLDAGAGPQTVQSLTMSAAGALNLQLGNLFAVSGAVSLAGTLNLRQVPSTLSDTGGTAELMAYASDTGTFAAVTGLPGGDRLVYTSTQLDIVAPSLWTAAVSGKWSNAGKWTGPVPNAAAAVVMINVPTDSPLTVTLNAPQTIGTLLLGNSATRRHRLYDQRQRGQHAHTEQFRRGTRYSGSCDDHRHRRQSHDQWPVVLADNLTVAGNGSLAFGRQAVSPTTARGTHSLWPVRVLSASLETWILGACSR